MIAVQFFYPIDIFRIQQTVLQVKYINWTQFDPKSHQNQHANLSIQISGTPLILCGIIYKWGGGGLSREETLITIFGSKGRGLLHRGQIDEG